MRVDTSAWPTSYQACQSELCRNYTPPCLQCTATNETRTWARLPMCKRTDVPGYWRGGSWHQGSGAPFQITQPEACEFQRFRPSRIRRCLAGKRLFFDGNSLIRQVLECGLTKPHCPLS